MEYTQLIPLAVFGAITLGIWALLTAFTSKDSRASERLDFLKDPRTRPSESDGSNPNSVKGALQKAAPTLSKALQPKTDLEASALKVRLANAGFSSPNAATFYLAIKTGMLIAGLVLGGGVGVVTQGANMEGLTALVIGGGLGFYLPEIVLIVIRKQRMERVFLTMPDALDLLVVCVEAGLGLDAAMRRVSEELAESAPDICSELNMANMQLQMGRPRREVLHDLGVRTGVDDMRSLVAILIQADRFGSSIAQALRVQSDSMRVKRSQMAEEKAQQTAVKMIFPLVLFIFPGIFVVLVGPAAIMMIRNLLNT
ncbi:Bacterial type II secretion system protein F domain protein [Maioricimonas rarisocia]|uniref:Bacterial type II secretion system protein F domain protein n=1 Tax=Maioricimonas rarisocia TaxID=2528026 RepID=A0A517ZCS4_9PLAN|nr:type II secretion system F family protein [Maioricimonas rarisocia]QDU40293.1 Bacterial type II secretion system protein F domain protein [Maioricimonas rarisocia]